MQILSILILSVFFTDFQQCVSGNPAIHIGNFFQTSNFPVLMSLYRLHKIGRICQTLMGARIQPGKALTQKLYPKSSLFQIDPVKIRDLQLPASAWL